MKLFIGFYYFCVFYLIRKFCYLTNCERKLVKYNYSHDYGYNKNADIQKQTQK